jgi:hypothetical protein
MIENNQEYNIMDRLMEKFIADDKKKPSQHELTLIKKGSTAEGFFRRVYAADFCRNPFIHIFRL